MKLISWILGLVPLAAAAQEIERSTALHVMSDPHAFAGRPVAILCTLSQVDLRKGVCPVTDQIGRALGAIRINMDELSEADEFYLRSRFSGKAAQPLFAITQAGTIDISAGGVPILSRPRLHLFTQTVPAADE